VTEAEYRHAVATGGKEVFVFVAGDPETAEEYRASHEEKHDLKNWYFRQSSDQLGKLKKFKEQIRPNFVTFFRNLADFRERLEKTLTIALDNRLLIDVRPGSKLADLILALTPAIRNCTGQVDLLADCKKVHDLLHDLRQHVIRRIRDEFLAVWREQGNLTDRRVGFIMNRSTDAQRVLGRIEQLQSSIASGHKDLLADIDRLLTAPPLWDADKDERPGLDMFTEALEDFATAVEAAFSEADTAMRVEERALDVFHATLLEQLGDAADRWGLGAAEHAALDEEVRRIAINKDRIARALASHHDWQRAHDALEVLQGFRETNLFDKRLTRFVQADRATLSRLVAGELSALDVYPTAAADHGTGPAAAAPAVTETAPGAIDLNVDDFRSDLQRLAALLEALAERPDSQAFDQMRSRFDDSFYRVDKRTLTEVERASARVTEFERLLEGLAASSKKAA
jgi:hypothetical protein